MRPGPNGQGLSRAAIFAEVDNGLRRLGVDYVDLYQIHRFDTVQTPVEETMEALNDVVRAGKARYIGASSMWAWQFATPCSMRQTANGWTQFVSMQNQYRHSLVYREEEREMMPPAATGGRGVAVEPAGRRPIGARLGEHGTARSELNEREPSPNDPGDRVIVETVARIADDHGVPRAGIALAWMLTKPYVHSPIIGATKPEQLTQALTSVDITLDAHEIEELEAAYTPHAIQGHQ